MNKIKIVGAGMAGLLAAAMLRDDVEAVYERQASLPNNHHAVLRFRTQNVAYALNMEFKHVNVIKEMGHLKTGIAGQLAYSRKTTGRHQLRSSASVHESSIVQRYIAPADLIDRMAGKLMAPIKYGVEFWSLAEAMTMPIISTMPMPALMDNLQYKGERPAFSYVPGVSITATIKDCDAYATLYTPDLQHQFYRISITGDKLIIELAFPAEMGYTPEAADDLHTAIAHDCGIMDGFINGAMQALGVYFEWSGAAFHKSRYQKINAVDDTLRKRFIKWASEAHGVYSLGRFATWRPGLMLDDVPQDVRLIQRLIAGSPAYGV